MAGIADNTSPGTGSASLPRESQLILEHPEITKLSLVAIGTVLWLVISGEIDNLSFVSRQSITNIYGLAAGVFFMSMRTVLLSALLVSIAVACIAFTALLFDSEDFAAVFLCLTLVCFLALILSCVEQPEQAYADESRFHPSLDRGQDDSGLYHGLAADDWQP